MRRDWDKLQTQAPTGETEQLPTTPEFTKVPEPTLARISFQALFLPIFLSSSSTFVFSLSFPDLLPFTEVRALLIAKLRIIALPSVKTQFWSVRIPESVVAYRWPRQLCLGLLKLPVLSLNGDAPSENLHKTAKFQRKRDDGNGLLMSNKVGYVSRVSALGRACNRLFPIILPTRCFANVQLANGFGRYGNVYIILVSSSTSKLSQDGEWPIHHARNLNAIRMLRAISHGLTFTFTCLRVSHLSWLSTWYRTDLFGMLDRTRTTTWRRWEVGEPTQDDRKQIYCFLLFSCFIPANNGVVLNLFFSLNVFIDSHFNF